MRILTRLPVSMSSTGSLAVLSRTKRVADLGFFQFMYSTIAMNAASTMLQSTILNVEMNISAIFYD